MKTTHTPEWVDCSKREYHEVTGGNIHAERNALREEVLDLRAALSVIAQARPDRLNCSQENLWEAMRTIARAAIAKAKG